MSKNVENMWKAIESLEPGTKERYGMRFDELVSMVEQGQGFELAINSFNYGFIKGIRYQKAQEKKKRSGVK